MTDDDEAARKSRADELRKQIDSLKQRPSGADDDDAARKESESGGGVSPRDFIQEKMRELDS